jgi:hypothetical protein
MAVYIDYYQYNLYMNDLCKFIRYLDIKFRLDKCCESLEICLLFNSCTMDTTSTT